MQNHTASNRTITKVGTKNAGIDLGYNSIPFPVTTKVRKYSDHSIFIYGNTDSAFDFIDAIDVLNNVEEGDSVTIMLSGGGGCLSATDAFLHAIAMARDKGVSVHCVISGLCASAHTFIALSCCSFELAAGTHFLLHCGSLNNGGTLNEYRTSSAFHVQYMEERFKAQYEHFLAPQEIEDMLKGVDMWLTAGQFAERYNKRNEILLELSKAENIIDNEEETAE
jgi:ATP-dependent protease ClpP protease subunit